MKATIISDFEEFMRKHGKLYREFYVGVTNNPEERLRNGHGVTESIPNRYWSAPLETRIVREVERYFLDKGTKGGPGGGDSDTCHIYVYKISLSTRE